MSGIRTRPWKVLVVREKGGYNEFCDSNQDTMCLHCALV